MSLFFVDKITELTWAGSGDVSSSVEFLFEDGQRGILKLDHWDGKFSSEFVDVRNGCPPEHQEAFDAARAARAILVNG